jgi:hypothetical protein
MQNQNSMGEVFGADYRARVEVQADLKLAYK